MTEPEKKEELRPCPFCGASTGSDHGKYIEFSCDCAMTDADGTCVFTQSEIWENAYCWKEIDSLRQQLKDVKQQNVQFRAVVAQCSAKPLPEWGSPMAKLEQQLKDSRAREAELMDSTTARDRLRELEFERIIHKARTLWCDSKRDPETGFVDGKYLDQFEEAIEKSRKAKQI